MSHARLAETDHPVRLEEGLGREVGHGAPAAHVGRVGRDDHFLIGPGPADLAMGLQRPGDLGQSRSVPPAKLKALSFGHGIANGDVGQLGAGQPRRPGAVVTGEQ